MSYDDTPGLNWSTLKHMATSPRLLRWRVDHPRPDTPALTRGRAIHCAVLEPERWASEYVPLPVFPDGRTKAGKAAKAAFMECVKPGVEVLSASEHELAERCAEAVRSHPAAAELLRGGRTEETVTWVDPVEEIACKGRLDWIGPAGILDVKTTRHESIRLIASDCARYLYHGQLAWYHDGARAARLIPPDAEPPHVIFVQTCEPYDVVPARLSEDDLLRGRGLYRDLLSRYVECVAADWWPGMEPGVLDLALPGWAAAGTEDLRGDEW